MTDKINDAVMDYCAQQVCTDVDNDILTTIAEEAGTKFIFTSNYNRCQHHERAISISASQPPGYIGQCYYFLAPTWSMIDLFKKGIISEEEYSQRYLNLLMNDRKMTAKDVYNEIPNGSILLCYEKPGDFCHRRVLAKWLEKTLKVKIPEWTSQEELDKLAVVDSLLNF